MTDAHPNAPENDFPGDTPKNLPAKPVSEAEKQRQRMDALLTAVESREGMLRTLLSDTGISFERFVEIIRRAFIKTPELVECDAASVVESCINAATDGLIPDGREAALVIFRQNVEKDRKKPPRYVKRAQYIPMYQGLLKVAYASGNFRSIEARVVYAGDHFEYVLGDDPKITHMPKSRPSGAAQPEIVAAYAVAKMVNGGVFREVFEGADIAKVNAVSKARSGPAAAWGEEMARKGPLRRLWKFLPRTDAMARIEERDNETFDLSLLEEEPETTPPRATVRKGFAPAPAAIPQGADLKVDLGSPDDRELEPAGGAPQEESQDQQAPEPEADRNEEPVEEASIPEVATLQKQLIASTSWLNVKQSLKTFSKTEFGRTDAADRAAKVMAWNRMGELRGAGQDRTDFVTDPVLFECWLLGSDPDRDTVVANWAIVQEDSAFKRLAEFDRERMAERVAEAMGDDPE